MPSAHRRLETDRKCGGQAVTKPDKTSSRRAFLGVAGAGLGAVALAPGLYLVQVAQADGNRGASNTVRWGMLIDTTKCVKACDACVTACRTENAIHETLPDPRQASQWIRKIDLRDPRNGREHSLPMMCQHCAHPPCVDVCPTGASLKRADGIVLVDRHTCIGCRYCMMACPYKARSFVHLHLAGQRSEVPRGIGCVESCTFCVHRVDKGQMPACVEQCPEKAMLFGDLRDPDSEISRRLREVPSTQVRADLRLDLGVRYQGI